MQLFLIYLKVCVSLTLIMPKMKQNPRAELTGDGGPAEAPSQVGKENPDMYLQNADHQAVLAAIASL